MRVIVLAGNGELYGGPDTQAFDFFADAKRGAGVMAQQL